MLREIFMTTRRTFIVGGAAAVGAITLLPSLGFAAAHAASFNLMDGKIVIHPVEHRKKIDFIHVQHGGK